MISFEVHVDSFTLPQEKRTTTSFQHAQGFNERTLVFMEEILSSSILGPFKFVFLPRPHHQQYLTSLVHPGQVKATQSQRARSASDTWTGLRHGQPHTAQTLLLQGTMSHEGFC